MRISSKTDKGIVRSNNEDSILVIPPWDKLAIEKGACLFAVADGMGGQNAGEIASGLAVTLTKEWFEKADTSEITTELVKELITTINEKIWNYSLEHPETQGMGTTFSSIIIKDNKAIIGHIGDSRIIRVRNNQATQLTSDHSIVGEQVKRGILTLEQARISSVRNILTKVLGARQFVCPDVFEVELQKDDRFVLYTDGVYSMIECDKLDGLIKKTRIECLAKKLINQTNLSGGKDNSTVIALQITESPVKIPSLYSPIRFLNLLFNSCNKPQ